MNWPTTSQIHRANATSKANAVLNDKAVFGPAEEREVTLQRTYCELTEERGKAALRHTFPRYTWRTYQVLAFFRTRAA